MLTGKEALMVVLPLPSCAPNNGTLPLSQTQASHKYIFSCHSPAFLGCFHISNSSLFPRSDFQSLSFSTQSPLSLTEECLTLVSTDVVVPIFCAGYSAFALQNWVLLSTLTLQNSTFHPV